MILIVRLWITLYATAIIVKNIESCQVDLDLPYMMISISTIQSWLILYILMAHLFYILLMKEHNFKLVDGYKASAPNIHKMYYECAGSTHIWDPLTLLHMI